MRWRRQPEAMSDKPGACANCGQPFPDPPPAFCPACGQESRVRAPTLGEFAQQFGGAYLSTEGALWRTLKLLLLQPGELTRQYLAGRRRHYVLPLRLYLTVSLVSILLLRLPGGSDFSVQVKTDFDLSQGEHAIVQLGPDIGAGLKDGVFYCQGLPGWACRRLERRLDADPRHMSAEIEALSGRVASNLGSAMFALVPLFALLQMLVYRNRRLRYTEHLVFALHLHAFWFLCLLPMALPVPGLAAAALLLVPWYGLAALKRVYGGRWIWRWLRAALVSMVYSLALVFALAGALVWALLF